MDEEVNKPKWKVAALESGMKLISFLRHKSKEAESLSLKKLKKTIEANSCLVNGRPERFASYRLGLGDLVEFVPSPLRTDFPPISPPILYEDESLLACNKPPGVPSDKLFPHLHMVHRLDRETSGVLLFAKDQTSKEAIELLFKNRSVTKTYLALVLGKPQTDGGKIDNYVGEKQRYQGQVLMGVMERPEEGKHAITDWELIGKGNRASLLRCFPKTGRTHQIRVHLSSLGFPIVGDYQYNRTTAALPPFKRCMLHALRLEFPHPLTNSSCIIEVPAPEDFTHTLSYFGIPLEYMPHC